MDDLTEEQILIIESALEELTFFADSGVDSSKYKEKITEIKKRLDKDHYVTGYRLPKHPNDILHILRQELHQLDADDNHANYIIEDLKSENGIKRFKVTPRTAELLKADAELHDQTVELHTKINEPMDLDGYTSTSENITITSHLLKKLSNNS